MPSDAVSLARQLVRFPSLNPPGDEDACVRFVARHLEEMGFSVELHAFAPGRPSLVARMPGSTEGKPLVFTGHLDVVPVGTVEWRHPPFKGTIADGNLYGRGSCDMKSGIAAFIAAAGRSCPRGTALPSTGRGRAGTERFAAATQCRGRRRRTVFVSTYRFRDRDRIKITFSSPPTA